MKKLMLNAMLISGLLMAAGNVNAQENQVSNTSTLAARKAQVQKNKANRAAMKIAYITKSIALTPEQAKVFWPVYDKEQADSKTIIQNFKNQMRPEGQKKGQLSDAEIQQRILSRIDMKERLLELQKSYIPKYKTVISMKQIAKLYRVEQNMRNRKMSRTQAVHKYPPRHPAAVK